MCVCVCVCMCVSVTLVCRCVCAAGVSSVDIVGGVSSSITGLDTVLTLPLAWNLTHTHTHRLHPA